MGVDAASMQWFADAKAHKPKPTNTVPGITYMLAGWTCLPDFPGAAHDEPGCFDQVFLQFIKETSAGRTPNVQRVGISYMDGANGYRTSRTAMGSGNEFHVGPHVMIIGLDRKTMQTLN